MVNLGVIFSSRGLVVAALLLTMLATRSVAVEDTNVWFNYSIMGPLRFDKEEGSRWRYIFDSPNRFGDDASKYSQGIWRAGLGYIFNAQWSAWAGYGYSHTDVPYTGTPFGEHRTFQQLLWTRRISDFSFSSRFRLEERFPETGDDVGLRFRHQFRVSHPLGDQTSLIWVVWDELFLNLNQTDYGAMTGVDQNRAFAGIGWRWSETVRSEAGYLHHFNRRPGRENRVNHVLALSLAFSFR
jgi:hypothetical protein